MIYVLINPLSNNGKGGLAEAELKELFTGKELTFYDVTKYKSAAEICQKIGADDEIIVAGGDGTLTHFVNDVYEVSDVDTSTGNIEYSGNVCVLGNVKTGFSIKADGDVEVRGVVENATVEATGNVTIARGMNGMSKGTITAGGNVVAKFLENANVNAGGYVHSEAILHSNVICKGEVTVTGKKGFIDGDAA